MKTLIIVILLISSALHCFSQTTLEEWNYITKGYKIQVESGLDMKKGYQIVFDHKQNDGSIYCEFWTLLKVNRGIGEKVAIMVITNYDGGHYYCIPKMGNDEVDKLYQLEIYNWVRIKNPVSMLILWQITNRINWN